MKLAVYTAVGGRFDRIREPTNPPKGVEWIAFTDDVSIVRGKVWHPVRVEPLPGETPRRMARRYKILGHRYLQGYDATLWIDGCYDARGQIDKFVKHALSRRDFAVRSHPWRDPLCVYEEARACLQADKGDPEQILSQIERYMEEGYPANRGVLCVTGILARRHTEEVNAFCEAWYAELSRASDRDQLSLPYVAWKTDFDFEILPSPDRTSDHRPYFVWTDHLTEAQRRKRR